MHTQNPTPKNTHDTFPFNSASPPPASAYPGEEFDVAVVCRVYAHGDGDGGAAILTEEVLH